LPVIKLLLSKIPFIGRPSGDKGCGLLFYIFFGGKRGGGGGNKGV